MNKAEILNKLGIKELNSGICTGKEWGDTTGDITESISPIDGSLIAKVQNASLEEYELIVNKAQSAFIEWKKVPAPLRGEVVRQIGNALRERKEDLGYLITLEMGKIYQEGLGEVQEMIDICDFAVGQSRLLNGFTMHSERREHRIYDQYLPLGIVGLITSFNFPDDNFLLRFLRVKKFSLAMAEQTLLKYLNFRKKFKHIMFDLDYTDTKISELIDSG